MPYIAQVAVGRPTRWRFLVTIIRPKMVLAYALHPRNGSGGRSRRGDGKTGDKPGVHIYNLGAGVGNSVLDGLMPSAKPAANRLIIILHRVRGRPSGLLGGRQQSRP